MSEIDVHLLKMFLLKVYLESWESRGIKQRVGPRTFVSQALFNVVTVKLLTKSWVSQAAAEKRLQARNTGSDPLADLVAPLQHV